MLRITGTRQSYAWGTTDSIPAILQRSATDEPFAEYWLGAHPLGDAAVDGRGTLSRVLTDQPELLGEATVEAFSGKLPFLMKLLSAGSPLSLQAHPSRTQAEHGYAQESLNGIPLSAPERSFKDDWPKPEIIIALEPFEGLLGFRHPVASAELFEALGLGEALSSVIGPLRDRTTTPALQEVFLDVLSLGERRHLVDEVLAAAVRHLDMPGEVGLFAQTAVELDEHFPGDPGILAALLLNRFRLDTGEAVALGAGIMHAYLKGTGVEVMANSDNVLRGGLTPKHVDVPELRRVVTFEALPVPSTEPERVADSVVAFRPPFEEFELLQATLEDDAVHGLDVHGPGIAVVTRGTARLALAGQEIELGPGEAVFLPAAETASGPLAVRAAAGAPATVHVAGLPRG